METARGGKRFYVFLSAVIGWSFCFLCQGTLPSAIGYMTTRQTEVEDNQYPDSSNDPVFSKDDYGTLQNLFVIAYSSCILLGGFLSDYFDPRILFFLSLGMSGMLCAIFPLTVGNPLLNSLVWFFFGAFEGFGWPATAKMVKRIYTPAELGVWWSFLSCASNIAASISPLLVSYIVEYSSWQTSFYVTGLIPILLIVPLSMAIKLNSTPTRQTSVNPQSSVNQRWYQVFLVSTLQFVIVVYIILWVAKSSVNNWAQLYLQEVCQQLPRKASAVTLMQSGGAMGKLVSGNLSSWCLQKKLMKRTSFLTCTMFMVALLVFVFGAESFKNHSEIVILLLMFFTGFVIDGSVVLTNLAAMETVPDSLSGSALGLATFTSQLLGRSFGAGYPFTHLQQTYGWTSVYQGVAMLCIAAATLSGYIAWFND